MLKLPQPGPGSQAGWLLNVGSKAAAVGRRQIKVPLDPGVLVRGHVRRKIASAICPPPSLEDDLSAQHECGSLLLPPAEALPEGEEHKDEAEAAGRLAAI